MKNCDIIPVEHFILDSTTVNFFVCVIHSCYIFWARSSTYSCIWSKHTKTHCSHGEVQMVENCKHSKLNHADANLNCKLERKETLTTMKKMVITIKMADGTTQGCNGSGLKLGFHTTVCKYLLRVWRKGFKLLFLSQGWGFKLMFPTRITWQS